MCGCVGAGVLAGLCQNQWGILGGEEEGLHRLVMRHGVKGLLGAGLVAGVSRCRRDWAVELSLHRMEGYSDGSAEAPAWGEYGDEEGVGYHEARMNQIMYSFGGKEVCSSTDDVVVVATDGSGGDRVGMGVVVVKLDDVSDLDGAELDTGHMSEVRSMSARMPVMVGTGVTSNQYAEDYGGVAGLFACIADGAVILVVDNLQTAEDLVSAGNDDVSSRREAMRHRCGQTREMMRSYIVCCCSICV